MRWISKIKNLSFDRNHQQQTLQLPHARQNSWELQTSAIINLHFLLLISVNFYLTKKIKPVDNRILQVHFIHNGSTTTGFIAWHGAVADTTNFLFAVQSDHFLKYLHDKISNINAYSIVTDCLEVQSNKSAHLLPHEYFQVS